MSCPHSKAQIPNGSRSSRPHSASASPTSVRLAGYVSNHAPTRVLRLVSEGVLAQLLHRSARTRRRSRSVASGGLTCTFVADPTLPYLPSLMRSADTRSR
jgi:hypothetical protein